MSLIKDGQRLVGAKSRFGHKIATYDDGCGPLFIHRDSMGISGIVRAQTWEDAYSICEDEFFPEASETWEEMEKEYSTEYKSGRELWLHENHNNWEAWQALPEEAKQRAYRAPGKDVPFDTSDGGVTNHGCWQEAYGFRPNGPNATDTLKHGIYAKDLNGDSLDLLTQKMIEELEIALEITGSKWKVVWDNGNHASGEFPELHDTEEEAEAAGKEWVSNMEMSDPDAPEDSYTFDVVEVEDQPIALKKGEHERLH